MSTPSAKSARRDTLLLAGSATCFTGLLLLLSAPTATLFGGLLAGATVTLSGLRPRSPGRLLVRLSQGTVGVTVGAYVTPTALAGLGRYVLPVTATALATVLLSVASGQLLARRKDVDRPTGAFAMIAGGASGLTAVSAELGADERLVAVIQYLRVVLVVATAPALAHLAFAGRPASIGVLGSGAVSTVAAVGVWGGCLGLGLLLARLVPMPAASLLGPLVVSAAASLVGGRYGGSFGTLAQDVALAVIGVQIGLRFSPASLRLARHVLPSALLLTAALMVGCAGLGVLVARLAGKSALDGYLATTPGGLYVVLATASTTGADVTFVASVQVLRLLLVLLCAPLLAHLLRVRPVDGPEDAS